jgi:flagellar protein FliS
MNATALRAAYVSNSVETMSPGRMVVALYDRLVVDLERAEQAIAAADAATAHDCLLHAQSIVSELHDSLDVEQWPAGRRLKDVYVFLLFELVTANVEKDGTRVAACRTLVLPLRDAWYEAVGIVPTRAGGVT